MLLENMLNPKVIYHKGERNWTHLVPPEDWSVSGWAVSIGELFLVIWLLDNIPDWVSSYIPFQISN